MISKAAAAKLSSLSRSNMADLDVEIFKTKSSRSLHLYISYAILYSVETQDMGKGVNSYLEDIALSALGLNYPSPGVSQVPW